MQFHAWKHMIRMIPYDSMHETMTYRPSMQFHALNNMIPCDSMHGDGMKLSYGTIWFHAWNRMEDL